MVLSARSGFDVEDCFRSEGAFGAGIQGVVGFNGAGSFEGGRCVTWAFDRGSDVV